MATTAHHHAVQFYDSDEFLVDVVARYLAEGFRNGRPAIVIATDEHRHSLRDALKQRGYDVEDLGRRGVSRFLDAREMVDSLLVDGSPDRMRFESTIGRLIRDVTEQTGQEPCAYGEMVNVLWSDEKPEAALALEEMWNGLAERVKFGLLCGYSMGAFGDASHSDGFRRVCAAHTHVQPTENYLDRDDSARLIEVSMLQQRAAALEAELKRREQLERQLRAILDDVADREAALVRADAEREDLFARERAARADAEHARAMAEQANRAKSQFLAVMSHELRTPLNAIGGYTELLDLGVHGPVTQEQHDALDRIQRSQRHLLGLINQVLNYTRLETGNLRYDVTDVSLEDVARTVEALVLPQLTAKRLQFNYSTCRPAPVARADLEKVQQILLNLLANAIRFTDEGGRVTLDCGVADAHVVVEVRDTGIGIPEEKLEAIFEPFVQVDTNYTRSRDGVGLGLAISQDLARAMGGDITVASTQGTGSTFTLTLPRVS